MYIPNKKPKSVRGFFSNRTFRNNWNMADAFHYSYIETYKKKSRKLVENLIGAIQLATGFCVYCQQGTRCLLFFHGWIIYDCIFTMVSLEDFIIPLVCAAFIYKLSKIPSILLILSRCLDVEYNKKSKEQQQLPDTVYMWKIC